MCNQESNAQIDLVDDTLRRTHQQSTLGQSFRFPIQELSGDYASMQLLVNEVLVDGEADETMRSILSANLDEGVAIVLEVEERAFLRAGEYNVSLEAIGDGQAQVSETIPLSFSIAFAELVPLVPLQLQVERGEPLTVNLYLEEMSGDNGLWDLQISPSMWVDESGANPNLQVDFPQLDGLSIGPDSIATIQMVLDAKSTTLGTVSTNLIVKSDNLSNSLTVPIEVDIHRKIIWLFGALLIGLLVSYFTKIFLDKLNARAALRKEGGAFLEELDAVIAKNQDEKFRTKLEQIKSEVLQQMNARLREISMAGDALVGYRDKLEGLVQAFNAELTALQHQASGYYAVVSGSYALPVALRGEVDELVRVYQHIQDLLEAGDLSHAASKQKAADEILLNIKSVAKRILKSYDEVKLSSVAPLFKEDGNLLESWENALGDLKAPAESHLEDAEALRLLLTRAEAVDQVAYNVYRLVTDTWQKRLIDLHYEMQRFGPGAMAISSSDASQADRYWVHGQETIASTIRSLSTKGKRLEEILPSVLKEFGRSLDELKSTFIKITDTLSLGEESMDLMSSALTSYKFMDVVRILGPLMNANRPSRSTTINGIR